MPSLVDKEGYLWDNVAEVVANAKAAEVEVELRAQVQRALDFGVPLTHLDTHMGAVVSRPDLVEAYVKLGLEVQPARVLPAEPGSRSSRSSRFALAPATGRQAGEAQAAGPRPHDAALHERHIRGKEGPIPRSHRQSKPGVHYLILHCGYDDEELQAITASSKLRDTDRRVFTDPDFIAAVKKTGVEVVTWKQVREMNGK